MILMNIKSFKILIQLNFWYDVTFQPLANSSKVLTSTHCCGNTEECSSTSEEVAKLSQLENSLKIEKEKNTQLEAMILALTTKLEAFQNIANSFMDVEAKVGTKNVS